MMVKMFVSWFWRGPQGGVHHHIHRLSSFVAAVLLLLVVGVFCSRWSTRFEYSMMNHTSVVAAYNDTLKMIRPSKRPGDPPVLAYWIYGFKGEGKKMMRLVKAVYHPRNQYLLHLLDGDDEERMELAVSIASERAFRAFSNVNVVGKGYAVNLGMESGGSALAAMLHAAALLLRISPLWDWFFTLSSSDYPLFTQDDILFAFSSMPRDLNFVRFTNRTADQKRKYDYNRIVVDTALYLEQRDSLYYAVETRELPTTFDIFEGSPWMALSRGFTEHCIKGWDNFPRKLLMYYANVVSPLESYFHTVLCNTPDFKSTIVNQDLRSSLPINVSNHDSLVQKPAIFARPFRDSDPTLDELDRYMLNRPQQGLVPGKWCNNVTRNYSSCSNTSTWDDIDSLSPGFYGQKLQKIMSKFVVGNHHMVTNHCRISSH